MPAGAYYVIAPALWIDAATVGPNRAPVVLGGLIMQRVSLKDGEARSVTLTREPVEAVADALDAATGVLRHRGLRVRAAADSVTTGIVLLG